MHPKFHMNSVMAVSSRKILQKRHELMGLHVELMGCVSLCFQRGRSVIGSNQLLIMLEWRFVQKRVKVGISLSETPPSGEWFLDPTYWNGDLGDGSWHLVTRIA